MTHPKNKRLTLREKTFCEHYALPENEKTYSNGKQSAIAAGYSVKCAGEAAHEVLGRPHVQEYISRIRGERTENRTRALEKHADIAIEALREVAENSRSAIARVAAANSILDRSGHKPTEKIQSQMSGHLDSDVTLKKDVTFTIKIPNSKHTINDAEPRTDS